MTRKGKGKATPVDSKKETAKTLRTNPDASEGRAGALITEPEEEISFDKMDTGNDDDADTSDDESSSESDGGGEDEWENVWQEAQPSYKSAAEQYKDISVTVENRPRDDGIKTKGVSQRERYERLCTHMLHVHCLTYHGFLRNRWLNDRQMQKILLSAVPRKIRRGFDEYGASKAQASSHDSFAKLLGYLMHYWKEKFTVTQPGLRKTGYAVVENLNTKVQSEKGEKVENLAAFRKIAKTCKGSRDIGAQLFTALLRGLGVNSRLVFSLNPLGFGFSKVEMEEGTEQDPNKEGSSRKRKRPQSSDSDGSDTEQSGGFIREVKPKAPKRYDKDMKFPTFWTEVFDKHTERWIPIDPLVLGLIATTPDAVAKFEPRGSYAKKAKQNICYVVAYTTRNTAKDVTIRYLRKQVFPGQSKGFRLPPMRDTNYFTGSGDWYIGDVMRLYRNKNQSVLDEEDIDLALRAATAAADKKSQTMEGIPETISAYKNHPKYVLERNLRKEEAILQNSKCIKTLTTGSGDKVKEDRVFERSAVVTCKSSKNWYMEGRVVKAGQQPLKLVKTVGIRRRAGSEGDEGDESGNPDLHGLYARFQTEIWTPPPVVDGVIPKNGYGNADCYTASMIPQGAAHVNLKGAAKIAKKLGLDYAEAVTGFDFRKRRAVPCIEGVLVASENEDLLRDAWRAEEDERIRKVDQKRELVSLGLWKKFLMGLRIIEKVNFVYGSDGEVDAVEEPNPFVKKRLEKGQEDDHGGEELEEGGFIREESPKEQLEGGFIREEGSEEQDGGFFREVSDDQQVEGPGGFIREDKPSDKEMDAASDGASDIEAEPSTTASSPLSSLSSADFESDEYEEPPKKKAKRSKRR